MGIINAKIPKRMHPLVKQGKDGQDGIPVDFDISHIARVSCVLVTVLVVAVDVHFGLVAVGGVLLFIAQTV